ncbi:MAG: endonuclease/exonuclease/phosphatase family protein [Gemmatimonadota bacterium]|nr:MAG: endonuclease/exonuclease/phosphatase family protein [Gemmatimonadota bacterium]
MKRLTVLTAIAVAAFLASACDDAEPLGPADAEPAEAEEFSEMDAHRWGFILGRPIKVMTRNLYVGADVDPIVEAAAMGASLEEIAGLVDVAFQTLMITNYPERAGAFADEIKSSRPHLVGLQEVSIIEAGGTTLDFLAILLHELAQRNLDYRVAGRVKNIDLTVPSGAVGFVRLVDYDVVLARGDVEISNVQEQNYWARLEFDLGGIPLVIGRGWVAVDAKVHNREFRFFDTHLEPASDVVQQLQAAELMDTVNNVDIPVVLVGDLNTRADGSTTPTYETLLNAGYVDLWTRRLGPPNEGYTCCHAADLLNPIQQFYERIDFILVKNETVVSQRFAVGAIVNAWIVGEEQKDRTTSGLWPSDHGGVVARFRIPVGRHYAIK